MISSLDDFNALIYQEINGIDTSLQLFSIILIWFSVMIVSRDAAASFFQLSYELCFDGYKGFWMAIDFYLMVLFCDSIVCFYMGSVIRIAAQSGVEKSMNITLLVIQLFNCLTLCLKFYALYHFVWSKTDYELNELKVNKYSIFVWAQPKRPEYKGTKTGTFESLLKEFDADTEIQVDLEDDEQQQQQQRAFS